VLVQLRPKGGVFPALNSAGLGGLGSQERVRPGEGEVVDELVEVLVHAPLGFDAEHEALARRAEGLSG